MDKLQKSSIPINFLNNINLKISLLAGSTNEEENHKLKEWLNFVLDIPWSTYPIYDINLPISNLEISKLIQNARSTLDIDCYGFSESKEEILRQIINIKIGNSPQVLALCGPPGVGKTMFFSSLGKSLNMPVKFIQCGCINDKSFLSGHSVAYIGAHPGAILSAIKENKNFGCIFVLDEIDKIMDDGIIMNQLIHLLDSSQHNHFIDNYLGSNMPLDISKIYFCCTLNDPNKLSPVLKNRIKILNVNGYTLDEKIQIVKNYALPKIIFKSIFKNHKIIFEDNDIKYFIENKVIGEQGMRNIIISLKELIDKLQLEKMCNYSQKNDNQILTINKKMFPI